MHVRVVNEELSNLTIAERQLDRAIRLFFDEEDYVSSLTLAGAAEEILGKLLNKAGRPSILDEFIDANLALNGMEKGAAGEKKVRKGIASLANDVRNRYKHYQEGDKAILSVDFYAAEMIDRAVSNYWQLTTNETEQMERFKRVVLQGEEDGA